MWTAYSISFAVLLAVSAFAQRPSGEKVTAKSIGNRTVLTITGAARTVSVARDSTVAPNAPVEKLGVVAQTGGALILRDAYPSRGGSMSYCQAGTEEFLRVISIHAAPKETLHLKISSCRENIELADPGVQWDESKHVLSVTWLTPGEGRAKHSMYRITAGGDAELVKEP